jgi:hypothetical protein
MISVLYFLSSSFGVVYIPRGAIFLTTHHTMLLTYETS